MGILFNEGQRRELESLKAYARSIVQPAGRPEVDAVYGIPPTVAIEQRLSRGGRKSTVGTATEVWHFLRLLYVKLGVQHCVYDGAAVAPQTPDSIAAQLMTNFRGQHIGLLAPLVVNRKGVYTELADSARPRGFTHFRADGNFLPTTGFPRIDRFKEHTIELPVVSLDIVPENEALLRDAASNAGSKWRHVNHTSSHGADVPVMYSALQVGTHDRVVAVGRDLRGVAALLVVGVGAWSLQGQGGGTTASTRSAAPSTGDAGTGRSDGVQVRAPVAAAPALVHVAGAVRHPGVYRLSDGARVKDAVHRAGGATPRADLDAINAEPVLKKHEATLKKIVENFVATGSY